MAVKAARHKGTEANPIISIYRFTHIGNTVPDEDSDAGIFEAALTVIGRDLDNNGDSEFVENYEFALNDQKINLTIESAISKTSW